MTNAIATCIAMSTADGLRRLPLLPDVEVRQPEDERHHDGRRKNSQRGAELTRATTGQAAQAMSTPMTVNLP